MNNKNRRCVPGFVVFMVALDIVIVAGVAWLLASLFGNMRAVGAMMGVCLALPACAAFSYAVIKKRTNSNFK